MKLLRAVLLLAVPAAAVAGPPYVTDDPEPVEPGHWELYGASQSTFARDGLDATLPLVEVNFGAAPGLQLHAIAPLAFAAGGGRPPRWGPGDLEVGAKVRFVDDEGTGIQVGVFPIVTLGTGSASRGLGEGGATVFLPLWVQGTWGPWTTYGGGGYRIRTVAGAPESWFLGWLVQRRFGSVAIGAELYRETDGPRTWTGTTGGNVGAVIDLSELHHVLLSAGVSGTPTAGHAYVAWQATWGSER
jgi:hypothetical protein